MSIVSTTVGKNPFLQSFLGKKWSIIIVNKRVWNAVLGCSLKNDRMISVRYQGKPFNIMVIHSSILAWKIPWTEKPGRLQSMGSQRVRHDWVTSLSLFTFMHWRRKWQPTLVLLPGESHGQRSLVGYSPQGRKESDTTERLHFHFPGDPLLLNLPQFPQGWQR